MKKINVLIRLSAVLLLMFLFIIITGCSASEGQNNFQDNRPSEYNIQDLNGYGEWITINTYGNVWRPYTVNSWMPFDNGHWVFSNLNWTWCNASREKLQLRKNNVC